MSIFRKEKSAVIQKKITGLQQQLKVIEDQAAGKELQIEEAISAGSSTDKLFEQISQLRGNIEARRSILTKMEMECSHAVAKEAREVKSAELDKFKKAVEGGIAGLKTSLADISDAAGVFLEKEEAFRRQYSQLFAILGPEGVNFGLLPNVDVGFIALALSTRLPVNTPLRALATAEEGILSNLRAIRSVMCRRIAQARTALGAESPVAEPLATVAPKKKPVDGGKLLYRQQRRAGIERLKASRTAEATDRDEEVRAGVDGMDASADAAGRRHF